MKPVLVDTSVWVDHFRLGNPALVQLLRRDCVFTHPMVLGELACGTPPDRSRTLSDLSLLGHARPATVAEVMVFVEQHRLFGLGCGLVDMTLLASTLMTPGLALWTLDKRLSALAERLGAGHQPQLH